MQYTILSGYGNGKANEPSMIADLEYRVNEVIAAGGTVVGSPFIGKNGAPYQAVMSPEKIFNKKATDLNEYNLGSLMNTKNRPNNYVGINGGKSARKTRKQRR